MPAASVVITALPLRAVVIALVRTPRMALSLGVAGMPLCVRIFAGKRTDEGDAATRVVPVPTGPRTVVDVVTRVVTAGALVGRGMGLGEETSTLVPRRGWNLPRVNSVVVKTIDGDGREDLR